ncbi:MAG TPA: alpha/beta hydrolase [Actinomycetota bacterium]|nr:alpha/beta hydrolase [Actinomycetota bacterium]
MSERGRRGRRLGAGLGVAAGVAATAIVAERLAVRRLRRHHDPESGEDLGELPPDNLGPVRSADGTEIAVRAAGPEDAPIVVFSHGFSLDMTTWYYQWRRFSGRYRCVLFDHRSHGRSGKPATDDYSVRAMGQDLLAVVDHVAAERPVVLVGHSMGGMAIIALAEAHPEMFGSRIRGVVLADTAASDIAREFLGSVGARLERALRPVTTALTRDLGRVERFRGRLTKVTDLSFLIARATQFGPGASSTQVDYLARLSAAAPVEVWVHTAADIREMDLRAALESITVPSLVVVGDRDMVTPKTSALGLRDALPEARAVVITRAGHVSMMEQHDVFNEVLTEYLDDIAEPKKRRRRALARR